MYFNNSLENTNIDSEFNNNKTNFNLKYVFIGLGIVFALGIIIFAITYIKRNANKYYIDLAGEETIKIYAGSDYVEPGYSGYDKKGNDLTSSVVVDSQIDTKVPGNYEILYTLNGTSKTRYVIISEKPIGATYIYLKGDLTIYLKTNETFKEPGYIVVDTVDSNLGNKMKITNNINTSKPGNYRVVYSVVNSSGVTTSASRTVIVVGSEINLSLNPTTTTKGTVNIMVSVIDPYFDYIILPNGTKANTSTYTYPVTKNGTYTFVAYNTKGSKKESSIKVSNISTEGPKLISCNGTIQNGKTTFTVSTNASDISKFVFNDNASYTTTSKTYTINAAIENGKVTAYDSINNKSSISCSAYYKEILPKGTENIKYNESTNTLKVWIEVNNRSGGRINYYTTHIWVKDAYSQFKSNVPDNFGKELVTAPNLLKNAIAKHNFNDKLVVGINGSGFVLAGTWGQGFYNANPAWNKTGGSPLVLVEGKVLRDFASSTVPSTSYVTYGLKKDGYLAYYAYTGGKNLQSNIDLSKKIISDGVKDTFSFSPVLVWNGQIANTATDQNIRQAICQIDKNNFVFITDNNSARSGFNYKELATYMVSLGCKTGFNFDGGGSTSLMIKTKTSSVATITGGVRAIADIAYFHE